MLVRDVIPNYLPFDSKLVFFGTMATSNARAIDNSLPIDPFFYQSNRNRFWQILSIIFENKIPKFTSNQSKREFAHAHSVGLANIVESVDIPDEKVNNSSDEVLFEARRNKKITYKKVPNLKEILDTKIVCFTCNRKPEIEAMIVEFLRFNEVNESYIEKIIFLPSPTRRCAVELALKWLTRMNKKQ